MVSIILMVKVSLASFCEAICEKQNYMVPVRRKKKEQITIMLYVLSLRWRMALTILSTIM